jgi:predicted  nucleic acid-binding Zn-ribbon protein
MLIEFEDTKQHNNESNEAIDDEISQLRNKQHDLQNKITDADDHIQKLLADNEDSNAKYNDMKDS